MLVYFEINFSIKLDLFEATCSVIDKPTSNNQCPGSACLLALCVCYNLYHIGSVIRMDTKGKKFVSLVYIFEMPFVVRTRKATTQ